MIIVILIILFFIIIAAILLTLLAAQILYSINKKLKFFSSFSEFKIGLGTPIVLAVIFIAFLFMIAGNASSTTGEQISYLMYFISLSQFIYLIPIILILLYYKFFDMVKGIVTAALLIALFNGSCFLIMLVGGK